LVWTGGRGGGAVTGFSSCLIISAFFRWIAVTSIECDRALSCPNPKACASIDSLGPIGVYMLRDLAGALFGCSIEDGSDLTGGSLSDADGSTGYAGGIDWRLDSFI
jgi:hypothetical protein